MSGGSADSCDMFPRSSFLSWAFCPGDTRRHEAGIIPAFRDPHIYLTRTRIFNLPTVRKVSSVLERGPMGRTTAGARGLLREVKYKLRWEDGRGVDDVRRMAMRGMGS